MNKYSQRPRRAVILGGGGFLGSAVSRGLRALGWEVVVMDRRPADTPSVPWIVGDVRDPGLVERALRPGDALVHLFHSSIPLESLKNPEAERSENVVPFMELVARVSHLPLSLLVYSSSGGQVYGQAEVLPIPESHPCRPITPYGKAKLAMEDFLRTTAAATKLPYLILRLANPYGPRQELTNRHGVIPRLFQAALRGSPFTAYGLHETVRDYIYIDDAGEAVARLMEAGAQARAVNVGTGQGTALVDLVRAAESVCGRRIEVHEAPIRPADVRENVLDVHRLKKLTGFSASVGLGEGLHRTWEYIKTHEET
jgi:UDP-glucose 4-epimerase